MRGAPLAIAGFLLLLSTSASKTANVAATIHAKQWKQRTISLLMNSQNVDGGYSLLTDQHLPSLYDTYYNLLLLTSLRKYRPLHLRHRLALTLSAMQTHPISLNTSADVSNLFYEISTDKLVGVPIRSSFRLKVEHAFGSLPTYDGLVTTKQQQTLPVFTALLVTETYIKIFQELSLPIQLNIKQSKLVSALKRPTYRNNPYLPSAYVSLAIIEGKKRGPIHSLLDRVVKANNADFSKPASSVPDILTAISWAEFLNLETVSFRISPSFKRSLSQISAKDGGYNIFSKLVMDPKITYQLQQFFHVTQGMEHLPQEIKRTQLPSGLYGWNNFVTSDPMDSYWALQTFRVLGYPIPSSLRQFFRKLSQHAGMSIANVWAIDSGRSLLGMEIPQLKVTREPNLADELMLIRTLALNPATRPVAAKLLQSNLGVLNHPDTQALANIYLILSSASILRYSLPSQDRARVAKFIVSLQKSSGGFGPPGQNNGDLLDTYYCVSSLKYLNAKPSNMARLRTFLREERNNYGGYAAGSPGSSSDLADTFYGSKIYSLLFNN